MQAFESKFARTMENLKICTLMDYFCRKYAMFWAEKLQRSRVMKYDYGFKNDIKNLVSFHTSSWK